MMPLSYSIQQNEPANSCCGTTNKKWGGREVGLQSVITHDLAREMNDLTVHERERVFEDIHGVAQAQNETPEFMDYIIQKFDKAISELPKTRRKALDRAFFLRPSFRTDTKFKLMFLRSDEYDAKKAASRMANFFVQKQHMFGENKLGKTITLDDLDETDMEVLGGLMMQFAGRDQVGRPIVFLDMGKSDMENAASVNRVAWYRMMGLVMDDELGQKKGMVCVEYHRKDSPSMLMSMSSKNIAMMKKAGEIMASMPWRMTSMHQCFENPDDPQLKLLSMIRVIVGKEARLRMKIHFGSTVEIQYALLTYGIRNTKSLLYRKASTKSNREVLFQNYIKQRIQRESALKKQEAKEETRSGIILHPTSNDVLMGRGTPYQDYIGNIRWSKLIDSRVEMYRQCGDNNFAKTCVSMDAVKTVQQDYGGRFIQQTSEGWKVVDNDMARKKAASAFRMKAGKRGGTSSS